MEILTVAQAVKRLAVCSEHWNGVEPPWKTVQLRQANSWTVKAFGHQQENAIFGVVIFAQASARSHVIWSTCSSL